MTCPLLFRFRTIDRLPEPSSPDAVRGTVVHKVLEDLFDLPAAERTPERGRRRCCSRPGSRCWPPSPRSPRCSPARARRSPRGWRPAASRSARYFALEDPRRLEPAERELYVETLLDSKLLLRGFVDRLDVAPDGAIRVVDYKTGRSPGVGFEAKALFQMKFYALVIWRTRGRRPAAAAADLPRQRRDAALRARRGATCSPPSARSRRSGRRSAAARETGDWRPSAGPLCALVRAPGALPGVRRHPAAAPGARGATRRARHRGSDRRTVALHDLLDPGVVPPRQRHEQVGHQVGELGHPALQLALLLHLGLERGQAGADLAPAEPSERCDSS